MINHLYALCPSCVVPQLLEAGTLVGMTSCDGAGGVLVVQMVGKVWGPCIILAGELNLSRGVSCSLIKWSSAARGQSPRGLRVPFLNQYCTAVVKGTGFVSQLLSTFPLPAPPTYRYLLT